MDPHGAVGPTALQLAQRASDLLAAGRLAEAESAVRQLATALPGDTSVAIRLADILIRTDRPGEATDVLRRSIDRVGDDHDLVFALGKAFFATGATLDAERLFGHLTSHDAGHFGANVGIVDCMMIQGRRDEAVALASTVGDARFAAGDYAGALAMYDRILAMQPDHTGALAARGVAKHALGDGAGATRDLQRAAELIPEAAVIWLNLGACLLDENRPAEALEALDRARTLDPCQPLALMNTAAAHVRLGEITPALEYFDAALSLDPNPMIGSARLVCRLYDTEATPGLLRQDAEAWAARHAPPIRRLPTRRVSRTGPTRVGYLSGDFRWHPVGRIVAPVIEAHDRSRVLVVCYSEHPMVDQQTVRIGNAVDAWRNVHAMSDDQLAAKMEQDGIDVLVDLAGHTANNRAIALAGCPAPVQISWLGFLGTTGLPSMAAIIGDEHVFGADDVSFTEQVIRLPRSFLCYDPPTDAVVRRPAGRPFTFGSLNSLAKLNKTTLGAWGEVLRAAPATRLLLQAAGLDSDRARRRVLDGLGVSSDRVTLLGEAPFEEYLARYAEVDLALDPLPYNGGITSLDGLWMGTPLLTLHGDRMPGRLGSSILHALGMPQFVAATWDEYIAKAVDLAARPAEVRALGTTLRDRMRASPLCDPHGLARALEDVYVNLAGS